MENATLRSQLLKIADNLPDNASLEDVYEQLALLHDIDMAEIEVEKGEVHTHAEVRKMASQWLK